MSTERCVMRKSTLAWILFVLTSAISVPAQSSVLCSFSGSGSSGVDCLGQTWTLGNDGWGIPGIGNSVTPFLGGVQVTDFHITFTASGTFDGLIGDPSAGFDTRLLVAPFDVAHTWSVVVSGNTADYFAPPGGELSPGQTFFVNTQFLNGLGSGDGGVDPNDVSFTASWTTTTVPEPGSLALLAVSLAGLGFARRSKSA